MKGYRIMKVIRILEGERYTACVPEGTGYLSATAEEDGFEIDDRGAVFWVTDAQLEAAIRERNRAVEIEEASESVEPEPTQLPEGLDVVEAVGTLITAGATLVKDLAERCPRCFRVGSKGPCSFDCATCHRCKTQIPDAAIRVFTTADRVYCMDCGTHA